MGYTYAMYTLFIILLTHLAMIARVTAFRYHVKCAVTEDRRRD